MTKPTVTQNLMRMLNLSPVEAAPASFGSDEVSTGVTLTREQPRTFGGQVLAQSIIAADRTVEGKDCLLYTSPSPRDKRQSRMPSSA